MLDFLKEVKFEKRKNDKDNNEQRIPAHNFTNGNVSDVKSKFNILIYEKLKTYRSIIITSKNRTLIYSALSLV